MKQTGKDPEKDPEKDLLEIYKIQEECKLMVNKICERYQDAVEGCLIKNDMDKALEAINTMAAAAIGSIIREKNRLQTVTIHQDPTTRGIIVTVQPAPREPETQKALSNIMDALELARLAGHENGV